eukprot:3752381-Alexandrium_andersonii.AAC.1
MAAAGQDLLALADGADAVGPDQVALVLTEWLAQPVTATAVVALDPTTETYRPLIQVQVGPAGGPALTRLATTGQ